MSEQLALDLDPDRWLREMFDDMLVPSEPVEPDSPAQRAEIAARVDEYQDRQERAWAAARATPIQPPRPVRERTVEERNPLWWVRLQKKLGNL